MRNRCTNACFIACTALDEVVACGARAQGQNRQASMRQRITPSKTPVVQHPYRASLQRLAVTHHFLTHVRTGLDDTSCFPVQPVTSTRSATRAHTTTHQPQPHTGVSDRKHQHIPKHRNGAGGHDIGDKCSGKLRHRFSRNAGCLGAGGHHEHNGGASNLGMVGL